MKYLLIAACLSALFPFNGFAQMVTEPSKENGIITSHIPGAVLLRGPYLQVPTDSTMIIRWRTDLKVNSIVEYGTREGNMDKKFTDYEPTTEHILKLHHLTPDTKYYYSISYYNETENSNVKLQGDENNFFYTLPISGKAADYRIGFLGDPGSLSTLQGQVRDQFVKYLGDKELNAIVILGDIAYDHGLDVEYQAKFFNVYKDMLKKNALFTTPGNHDYHDDDTKHAYFNQDKLEYYQDFSMPINGESGGLPSHNPAYYSIDIGNAHLLFLDSFGAEDSTFLRDTTSVQMQWVKADLKANTNKEWIIVCTHFPPYSMGSHNSDEQYRLFKIRENVLPILERSGVDLFIAGHSHLYERSGLMEKSYGKENTFNANINDLSASSGAYNGNKNSCPYIKDSSNRGTVYVVNGGSSELGGVQKSFPHKAMYYSDATYGGANLLEVRGNRLDWKWICQDGVIRDQFTIMKNVNEQKVVHIKKGESVTLTASYVGDYKWNNEQSTKSIKVNPRHTTTFSVQDKYNCLHDSFKVVVH
jgi:UDP-2,3-diacylglucosamine pyrophosphatase LpxH